MNINEDQFIKLLEKNTNRSDEMYMNKFFDISEDYIYYGNYIRKEIENISINQLHKMVVNVLNYPFEKEKKQLLIEDIYELTQDIDAIYNQRKNDLYKKMQNEEEKIQKYERVLKNKNNILNKIIVTLNFKKYNSIIALSKQNIQQYKEQILSYDLSEIKLAKDSFDNFKNKLSEYGNIDFALNFMKADVFHNLLKNKLKDREKKITWLEDNIVPFILMKYTKISPNIELAKKYISQLKDYKNINYTELVNYNKNNDYKLLNIETSDLIDNCEFVITVNEKFIYTPNNLTIFNLSKEERSLLPLAKLLRNKKYNDISIFGTDIFGTTEPIANSKNKIEESNYDNDFYYANEEININDDEDQFCSENNEYNDNKNNNLQFFKSSIKKINIICSKERKDEIKNILNGANKTLSKISLNYYQIPDEIQKTSYNEKGVFWLLKTYLRENMLNEKLEELNINKDIKKRKKI